MEPYVTQTRHLVCSSLPQCHNIIHRQQADRQHDTQTDAVSWGGARTIGQLAQYYLLENGSDKCLDNLSR